MNNLLKHEIILSPIKDEDIRENLKDSPIWDKAFKEDEITSEIYDSYPNWYEYHIKFDGLVPIQLVKINPYRK